MCIYLGTPEHYCIAGLSDYKAFLRHVHLLVQPGDFLSFGYECDREGERKRPDIREFFERHQLPPDKWVLEDLKKFALWPEDHPGAFAVRWPFDPSLLRQLGDLLQDSVASYELCDHVMGYGPRGAMFCFHDAFYGGTLRISTRVPQAQVAEFCGLMGLSYEISDREA